MSLLRNPMTRMLPAKATGLVGALLASVFMGGPSTAMEQLPFNDGLYAADTRFCLLSDDQAGEAYSGWIGVWTRSISKSTYTNNFELLCGIQKVSRTGQRVKAVAECSGEGDDSRTILEFKAVSRDSFVIDGKRFDRCGSDASIDTQIPTTAELVKLAVEANADCRGLGSPESDIACAKRDLLDGFLYERGMCSTEPDWLASQEIWHVCHDILRKNE